MIQKLFFLTLMVILAGMPAAASGFEVTAHVDKTRISKDDSVFLRVEVQGGKADLDLSGITDFKVMPRGSSSSYNFINGKSERKATFQYVLLPKSAGTLKIPPITARMDGEVAKTEEIAVQVVEQVVPSDDVKDLFATAQVVQSNLFVGQQTVYTLSFYTSKRLTRLGFESPPRFDGFFSKPFDKERTYTRTINGVLFQVTEVSYLIVPEKPGTLTIDPAVLIAGVIIKSDPSNRFDSLFNDSLFMSDRTKPMRVFSNPVKISVAPLPAYKGTQPFSGLVGRFDIEAGLDKKEIKAGESATLSITISGSGNVMDAGLPEIDLDSSKFKVYDDHPAEEVNLTPTGYEGHKIFKKAIVPVSAGRYILPPVSLTYFDVDQNAYRTIETREISLAVTPSEATTIASAPLPEPGGKPIVQKEVTLVNRDILEIRDGLETLTDYKGMSLSFWVLLTAFPALFFMGARLFILIRKTELPVEKEMARKAQQLFKQASRMDVSDDRYLSRLYSALTALVLSKAKKRGENVTLPETRGILAEAGMPETVSERIVKVFETLESIRFGGRKLDDIKARMLEKEIGKLMKLLCLVLVFAGLFAMVPPKASADSAALFVDGIKAYRSGHYEAAAKTFEAIAQKPVRNPYLYYNIGNAYLKAGDLGRAILWYERARRLAPDDPDLKYNLAYARTLVKDKKENGPDIVDILFSWDSLVPIRVLRLSAVFFSLVFFVWGSVRVLKQKPVFSGKGILLVSLFFLAVAVNGVNFYQRSAMRHAVVVAKEAPVRSGVADTATRLFNLHAGTMVRVEEVRKGYLKVFFSKDRVGWMDDGDALIVEAQAPPG